MPRHRKTLTVLDLFAGAGGMALGFEAAGARCIGAVESEPIAVDTFRKTFASENPVVLGGPEQGDMVRLSPDQILRALPSRPDLVVGGPPCQGFSRIGRAKQMSLLEENDRARLGTREPDRNQLYRRFLSVIEHARPKAFVMENVPGLRQMLGIDMAGRISREASHLGYNVRYFLLNSAWYGVPQRRWRLFFVGFRSDLGHDAVPRPPMRTHDFGPELPEGMNLPEDKWMVSGKQIPRARGRRPAVTVREAINDLPRLRDHLAGGKPVDAAMPLSRPPSAWVEELRAWPGREASELVAGNWYRSNPRDYHIFREMSQGDLYPDALRIAVRRFHDRLAELRSLGSAVRPGTSGYIELKRSIVPPYRNDAFDEKWAKLIPGEPSWTVTAHLSKDSYSHIHYDSAQARTITIREAARLQSFPDSVEFAGNYGEQFRQIGNAVPPLLARAIAEQLLAQLDSIERA